MNSKKTKILFLDIDGVLNHNNYGELLYDKERDLTKFLVEKDILIFKDNLENLKLLLTSIPDLKIVWSTNWRFTDLEVFNGYKNPLFWLEKQPWIKERVIGKTPKKMTSTKSQEIHFWFVENEFNKRYQNATWMNNSYYDVSGYVILDDYDDILMSAYNKHFYLTEYDKGLTKNMADDIIEYMKVDNFDPEELNFKKRRI